jgi:GT2 family glycosyltransferase
LLRFHFVAKCILKSVNKAGLVCCVVVNWNGWSDTVACLESLAAQTYSALQVIVVDNGSEDESVDKICAVMRQLPLNAQLVEAGANLGFAAGTNVGLRKGMEAKPEFFWLLNNDTVCPPDTLEKLVRKTAPGVGVVGSVLYFQHDPSRIQAWGGGRIDTLTAYSTHFDKPHNFDATNTFATFASVLIPHETIAQVGLLWEGYFMYFDDADFCLRARKAGWRIVIAEDTAVLHREGGSLPGGRSPGLDQIIVVSGLRFLERQSSFPQMGQIIFLAGKILRRLAGFQIQSLKAVFAGLRQYRRQRQDAVAGFH